MSSIVEPRNAPRLPANGREQTCTGDDASGAKDFDGLRGARRGRRLPRRRRTSACRRAPPATTATRPSGRRWPANPTLGDRRRRTRCGGGFGSAGFVKGIEPTDKTFEPVNAGRCSTSARARPATVKVIGVIETGRERDLPGGLHVSQSTFDSVFGEPDSRRYFVKTTRRHRQHRGGARDRVGAADDGRAGGLAAQADRRPERDASAASST